jgi:hypothetical protein
VIVVTVTGFVAGAMLIVLLGGRRSQDKYWQT